MSLWSSIDIVKDGILWRVEDGRAIKVWQDRWLPSPSSYKVQSLLKNLPYDANVNQLIDADSGSWNRDMIFYSFSRWGVEDKWGGVQQKMVGFLLNLPITWGKKE